MLPATRQHLPHAILPPHTQGRLWPTPRISSNSVLFSPISLPWGPLHRNQHTHTNASAFMFVISLHLLVAVKYMLPEMG